MEVGKRISAWRKFKGKTLDDLADAADVTRAAVYQWENGLKKKGQPREEIKPSLDKLEKVVSELGITMARFWGPLPKARAS